MDIDHEGENSKFERDHSRNENCSGKLEIKSRKQICT